MRGADHYVWTMRVSVEVCVTSFEEALAAERCGADSIELCTWLACGGLTPSIGLVATVVEGIGIPVRVLVRATPGGFFYSDDELKVMLRDIATLTNIDGLEGLVIGALDHEGVADRTFLQQALALVGNERSTFHRAIDRSNDPRASLERCLELGVGRVLTSGAASLAIDGTDLIAWMVGHAHRTAHIAAAGGINATNVIELIERTGVSEVHFAAQLGTDFPKETVTMSSKPATADFYGRPDVAKIEAVLEALDKAGLR